LTNYEAMMAQAEGESTPECVIARRLLFRAERLRRFEDPELAISLYEEAWPYLLNVFARFPDYAKQPLNQEDAWELQWRYIRLVQTQRTPTMKALALGAAQLAVWPHVPLDDLLESGQRSRILPIRNVEGPLEWARVWRHPDKEDAGRALLALTQTAGVPRPFLFPGQNTWTYTTLVSRQESLPPGWSLLIDDNNIRAVKTRLGLIKIEEPEQQNIAP
jgi:hypothetical protein